MRKLLLFLLGTTNANFSWLIISCDSEMFQTIENSVVLNQNDDEKIMQQFINEVKKIDFELSEHDLPNKIQTIVSNKLNDFIKKNKKYQNISFTIEKISKINENHYIVSYLSLLQEKQHIKFASTLSITINPTDQTYEFKSDFEEKHLQEENSIEIDNNEEQLDLVELFVSIEMKNNDEDTSYIMDQQVSLKDETKTLLGFSLDYQEKFNALQQEARLKTFEYDFAQTIYSDFITTVVAQWLNQKLTNLNYKIDLVYDLSNEIMGNTISTINLNIIFNNNEKTKHQLLIQVKCKEKANQAYHTIADVWRKMDNLQKKIFVLKIYLLQQFIMIL